MSLAALQVQHSNILPVRAEEELFEALSRFCELRGAYEMDKIVLEAEIMGGSSWASRGKGNGSKLANEIMMF